jgi:Fe-S cluster biogenesis protein NfuA
LIFIRQVSYYQSNTAESFTTKYSTTIMSKEYLPDTDPLYDKVINALEDVRPYLQADGGDCQLVGITKDMVVDVKLLGACGSCPMSTLTLRAGVEQAVKKAIPDIARVESV